MSFFSTRADSNYYVLGFPGLMKLKKIHSQESAKPETLFITLVKRWSYSLLLLRCNKSWSCLSLYVIYRRVVMQDGKLRLIKSLLRRLPVLYLLCILLFLLSNIKIWWGLSFFNYMRLVYTKLCWPSLHKFFF